MFGGGNRTIAPKYHVDEQSLRLRPYNDALNAVTQKACNEIGLGESDVCLFETRTAFDCVLRQKVQKFGPISDNLGHCSAHIHNMKVHIEKSNPIRSDATKILDEYV
jgi:hypothetical protein